MELRSRSLDHYETFFALPQGDNAFNQCLALGFSGKIDSGRLRRAVDRMQSLHPLMCVGVSHTPTYHYTQCGQLKLNTIDIGDRNWEEYLFEDLHTPIQNYPGPLFRITLLNSTSGGVLLLSANHLAADGISLAYLMKQLLTLLADNTYRKSLTCKPYAPPRSIGDMLSQQGNLPRSSVTAFTIPTSKEKDTKAQFATTLKTGLTFRQISNASDFKKQCKEQGIGVHFALSTALLFTLARQKWQRLEQPTPLDVVYQCPVNLRRFLSFSHGPERLGCYISTLYFPRTVHPSDNFWRTCKDIQDDICDELHQGLPVTTYESIQNLVLAHDDFQSIKGARNPKKPFVGVSNLGRTDISTNGTGYKIDFLYPTVALQGQQF